MSHKAARARRDTSEAEIIAVLKIRGFWVWHLAQKGRPDLVVGRWGVPHVWLIECKTDEAELRTTQQWAELGVPVTVLRTAEEAMQWNR